MGHLKHVSKVSTSFPGFLVSFENMLNKDVPLAGDFNINILDFDNDKKIQSFLILMYYNGMIPTIKIPLRLTKNTISTIVYIFTNSATK